MIFNFLLIYYYYYLQNTLHFEMSKNLSECVWKYSIVSNKGNQRLIIFVEKTSDPIQARYNFVFKLNALSKYGVPSFYYNQETDQMVLSHSNDKKLVDSKEYVVLNYDLITYFTTCKPDIVCPEKVESDLNVHAAPFRPTKVLVKRY